MMESLPLTHLPIATLVLALAYLIRGVTGFGSGLVAVPLLAMILPLSVVVPVIALLDFFASLSHGIGNRRTIQWKEIVTLLPFSLLGVLLAIYALKTVDANLLGIGLAVFVIGYAFYSLFSSEQTTQISKFWAIPSGGMGGMINSLFGTGGPFYVIYLRLRALSKPQLRATISMILLLDGIGRLIGYGAAGFFTPSALLLVTAGLPLGGLALYVGGNIQTDLSPRLFQGAVSALLLVSGIALFIQSVG